MLEEFKKFALRGNVVDLAVGVIIGAAFGAIVNSAVQDLFMPVIGAVTGGLDFSNYYIPLSSKVQAGLPYADAKKQGAVLGYGQFLTLTLNFLIVAFVLFLVIRAMNKLQHAQAAQPEKAAEVPADVKLLSEIRDILAGKPRV
ncbi:large conductance mechanosensitive channel protein MscL [Methylobacterium sp. CM6257]|jgi:large conductance mechanosensitive channel